VVYFFCCYQLSVNKDYQRSKEKSSKNAQKVGQHFWRQRPTEDVATAEQIEGNSSTVAEVTKCVPPPENISVKYVAP